MAGLSFDSGAGGGGAAANKAFKAQLNKVYGWYTGGFFSFVWCWRSWSRWVCPRPWIGFIFLLATVAVCRHRHHEPHQ
jgi:cation/acetate symporter